MNQDLNQITEKKWYQFWEEKELFKADPNSSKPSFGLLIPPPNLTGSPHLGHAMQHAILDAIARFKRMQGFDVLLLPGVDHAGIQFEGTLNKLLEKEGLSKQKLGREKWLKRAWQFKDEVYQTFHDTWTVFGLSADWQREVFTLEPKVKQAVFTQFKSFWEQGLIYKGAYIVQWCPKDQTAIEDVEMEYEEKKEQLYYINYPLIEAPDQYITIATARPETIAADVAIAVYPNHPKYKKWLGKTVKNPFTNKSLPVIEDHRVMKDFGTGALKITPGHDPLDYKIGKDHQLPILHTVDKQGRITELGGDLAGLKVGPARQKAVEKLEKAGLIAKVADYTHSVPVCERCKTIVEPLISEEWFVKMTPISQKALKKISQINFVPKNYQKILISWMKDIRDWCISRSLWWGINIPVWYCQKCNPHHLVGKDQAMVISLEKPEKNCASCKQKHWVLDEQVLDTWFSSGLWPLATLGWPFDSAQGKPFDSAQDEPLDSVQGKAFDSTQDKPFDSSSTSLTVNAQDEPQSSKEFKKYYPWSFELSGGEIKYLWIARMIMLGVWFTDKNPFTNMFFHGMIRDLQGRKFSKSLGNGIDPNELRNQWGTDATRMALYSYAAPGRDGKASRQTMDERCKNFRNFSTKLRNIARFIIELKPEINKKEADFSHPEDQDIIQSLNTTINQTTQNLQNFQLHLATEKLYDFIWNKFASGYLESSKKRRAEAQATLEYVFKISLELLHPFMPFITEELWQELMQNNPALNPQKESSIMLAKWPISKS